MAATIHPKIPLNYAWVLGDYFKDEMDANLVMLGALVQLSAKSAVTNVPASPVDGDTYIIPAAATGAWAGRTGQVAMWLGGSWVFFTPKLGWLCYVEDTSVLKVYKSAGWSAGIAI
jgi:hypothetical protein